MCVIRCYYKAGKDGLEKVEKFSWDPDRKVTKALLQKSKVLRFETWVPEEEVKNMMEKGWKVGLRADGTKIISSLGNVLLTFPEREMLKPFPF